jgi:hypothetical protein
MKYVQRFQSALDSHEPAFSLRTLAQQLAAEGQTKEQVYELFETFLLELRQNEKLREADEDAVLDVMDALTGWCHSDSALLPEK